MFAPKRKLPPSFLKRAKRNSIKNIGKGFGLGKSRKRFKSATNIIKRPKINLEEK